MANVNTPGEFGNAPLSPEYGTTAADQSAAELAKVAAMVGYVGEVATPYWLERREGLEASPQPKSKEE